MGDDAAHGDDRAFELLERGRILGIAGDQVDLLGEHFHGAVETGQVLRRGQHAQRVANLGQAALDACERYAGRAGVPRLIDALRQVAHFSFERFDRPPRHGFLQHHADLGEVVAQEVDRLVDRVGLVERADLRIDLAQLLLQAGKLLGLRARQRIRRHIGRDAGGRLCRQAVERPLAIGDLDQSLVERCLGDGRQARPQRLGAEVGHRAIDRAEALLDLAPGGPIVGDHFVEPAVEPRDHLGDLVRGVGLPARLRAGGIQARHRLELLGQIVEPIVDFDESVVLRELLGQAVETLPDLGQAVVLRKLAGQGVETVLDIGQPAVLGELAREVVEPFLDFGEPLVGERQARDRPLVCRARLVVLAVEIGRDVMRPRLRRFQRIP